MKNNGMFHSRSARKSIPQHSWVKTIKTQAQVRMQCITLLSSKGSSTSRNMMQLKSVFMRKSNYVLWNTGISYGVFLPGSRTIFFLLRLKYSLLRVTCFDDHSDRRCIHCSDNHNDSIGVFHVWARVSNQRNMSIAVEVVSLTPCAFPFVWSYHAQEAVFMCIP